MAATIRLARHGGKKSPFYRIVVADKRSPRDGRLLEQVGIYDPRQSPSRIEFKAEKLAAWLKKGALPSATVAQLIKKSGVQLKPDTSPGEDA
jgi:small subunit ribosomal protein S16